MSHEVDPVLLAKLSLEHGAKYPYDKTGPAKDWAHAAARGVLADLCDRRGIKWALQDVDDDVSIEIVESLAEVIRQAAPPAGGA